MAASALLYSDIKGVLMAVFADKIVRVFGDTARIPGQLHTMRQTMC